MTLGGVLAPVPTPFDGEGRLDLARFTAALSHWLTRPLAGIVVLGSTGEDVLMDDDERLDLVRAARAVVPRTKWLIAGTGRESTRSAIRAAEQAAAAGADAVLVRTPGFYRSQMTADALVAHYAALADSSPVPVLLYQFPALTGVTMERETVARLALHPNIVGMKDSSGDVLRFTDYASCSSESFAAFTGSAATFYQAVCLGAAGGILALACMLPEACTRLFEAARRGDHEEARALQQALVPIAKLVGSRLGVPGVKAAMTLVGVDTGMPRHPLRELAANDLDELRGALEQFESSIGPSPMARRT